jgi:hypothetical protein
MAIANIEHTLNFSTFIFYILFLVIYSQQKKRGLHEKGFQKL